MSLATDELDPALMMLFELGQGFEELEDLNRKRCVEGDGEDRLRARSPARRGSRSGAGSEGRRLVTAHARIAGVAGRLEALAVEARALVAELAAASEQLVAEAGAHDLAVLEQGACGEGARVEVESPPLSPLPRRRRQTGGSGPGQSWDTSKGARSAVGEERASPMHG